VRGLENARKTIFLQLNYALKCTCEIVATLSWIKDKEVKHLMFVGRSIIK
jgi:hypothetical protein